MDKCEESHSRFSFSKQQHKHGAETHFHRELLSHFLPINYFSTMTKLTQSTHSSSPGPISLQDLQEQVKPKTQVAKTNPSARAIINELPKTQELGPRFVKNSIIKVGDMAFQGVDLTSEAGQVMTIDWRYVFPSDLTSRNN